MTVVWYSTSFRTANQRLEAKKDNKEDMSLDELKIQLTDYLQKRKETNADELAQL